MYTIFAVTILKLVWVAGFEPASSHFQGEQSGQADNTPSYMVEAVGFEPTDPVS